MTISPNTHNHQDVDRGRHVMKAKVYERKDRKGTRFFVYLYWQGQRKKRYHDIDGQPFKARYRAERLAERINSEIESEGKNFNLNKWFGTSSNAMAFENYVTAWLDRKTDVTENYVKDIRSIANKYWIPFFGQKDIREIRMAHLEDFLASLPKRLSQRARQYYLVLLKSMLNDAYRREELLRVPPFPSVKVPEREIKWLTPEEQERALDAMHPHDRPIFGFMMYYGVRPGEARALQWDCINFDREEIIIKRAFNDNDLRETTKNSRVRVLPLMPEAEAILRPIRGIGGYVFRARNGRPYTKNWLMKIWRTAREKAGLPKVTLYQGCKHSVGMQKVAEGWDLEHVRELFGHRRIESTRPYARATTETLRAKLGGQTGYTKKGAKR